MDRAIERINATLIRVPYPSAFFAEGGASYQGCKSGLATSPSEPGLRAGHPKIQAGIR
jgi:hypothetical protein